MVKKIVIVVILLALVCTLLGLIGYFNHDKIQEYMSTDSWSKKTPIASVISSDIIDFVGNNYLVTYASNNVTFYDSNGNFLKTDNIGSNKAKLYGKGQYTAVVTQDTQTLYCYKGIELLWSKKMTSDIKNVSFGSDGQLVVCFVPSGYKSGVSIYDTNGTVILTSYLASKYAVDVILDNKSQSLYIAEVDLSGIKPKSFIRIIDAKDNSDNKELKNIELPSNGIVTDIEKYNQVIYVLTDQAIYLIDEENEINSVCKFEEVNTQYAIISDTNLPCTIEENITGNFTINRYSKIETFTNSISSIPQDICSMGNKIAVKIDNEVVVFDDKLNSICSCPMGDNIIGLQFINGANSIVLIYKNKIDFFNI